MIITINDIRTAGFCTRGAKKWFLDNGWSNQEFRQFIKHGMDADDFTTRGDHLAQYVVDKKRERESD